MAKKIPTHLESAMMSYGYESGTMQGAVKQPLFQASSFSFDTAEQAKDFFQQARAHTAKEDSSVYIYSRIANPNVSLFERRLSLYEGAEACAAFDSGMAAISGMLLTFLRPGDAILTSLPLYSGTDQFVKKVLPQFGIRVMHFPTGAGKKEVLEIAASTGRQLKMIYIESPANPTNDHIDIQMCREIADACSTDENKVLLAMDNTFMGPIWMKPLQHGVDLVLYSATKYIGGHSDLIAGACLGSKTLVTEIKKMRNQLGNIVAPHTAWLLLRSLETLKVRMDAQQQNAVKVADYLHQHPKVKKVYYPGILRPEDGEQYEIYKRQCIGSGAVVSFDIEGGEPEAYRLLNNLNLFKLAVSLGSTESLAQHPYTMTHANVSDRDKLDFSITPAMIRLAIGLENEADLIDDLKSALDLV